MSRYSKIWTPLGNLIFLRLFFKSSNLVVTLALKQSKNAGKCLNLTKYLNICTKNHRSETELTLPPRDDL